MMVRTQIQLTQEQADALRTIAAAQGISMAELIRKGVDYILAKQPIISIEERRRRAIAAAGSFRSDVTDASTNVFAFDEHFREQGFEVLP